MSVGIKTLNLPMFKITLKYEGSSRCEGLNKTKQNKTKQKTKKNNARNSNSPIPKFTCN